MRDLLQTVFQQLTHTKTAPSSEVYAYQQRVADALLSGHRVVLRAPEASGKGTAALYPWLTSRIHQYDFPAQLLYVLPGGTFFHDIHQVLTAATANIPDTTVGIQTEGDACDPFFLSDAVITSGDQLLSVMLHRPLGLHPGLSNTNAGVVLGSYLVFDEFPALASREAMMVWMNLLLEYYPTARCLWSTATWPRVLCEQVAQLLDAEFIDASQQQSGGTRKWQRMSSINCETMLRMHRGRTIITCNTVRGAQTFYRALRQKATQLGTPTELLLLHQHQFSRHRLPIEAYAATLFTPASGADAILVTTSGMKAVSELSAELLISDPISADKLLLRAGRCARFSGETGRMLVAPVSDLPPGDAYPAPSAESLLDLLVDGNTHSFADELSALDTLWESATPEMQPPIMQALPTAEECHDYTARVIAGHTGKHLFARVGVALHRQPETVKDPFELERFSLAIPSLERGWQQWVANGSADEWFALVPQWPSIGQRTPSWSLVTHPQEFRAEAHLIVLNAETVSYDPIIGLELAPGAAYQSERILAQHTTWSPFDQHVESFVEHATRALAAYTPHARWYRYVLRHLGMQWQIPAVELDQWIRLCILWHDAGKLTAEWQATAIRWQEETMRRPTQHHVLARIDYQYRRDGQFPCPPHAQVTGKVISRALAVLLKNRRALLQGTLAALSHHHGIAALPEGDLSPHPEAWTTLMELAEQVVDTRLLTRMDHAGWVMQTSRAQPDIKACLPTEPEAWMAYSLLARAIRLADREVALSSMFI